MWCVPLLPRSKFLDVAVIRRTLGHLAACKASLNIPPRNRTPAKLIEEWLSIGCNLGFACGNDSVVAIDFDEADAFESFGLQYPQVADHTVIQRTPRGYHVLLRVGQEGLRDSKLRFEGRVVGALRVRRWIAVPPSVHPSGDVYEWVEGRAPWESVYACVDGIGDLGMTQVREGTPASELVFMAKYVLTHSPRNVLGVTLRPLGVRAIRVDHY